MRIDDFKPEEVEWCTTCAKHKTGHCDGCSKLFDPQEPKYHSQSHHFHPGSIEGIPGTMAIHLELCLECYRKDWKQVYPKLELPV